MNLDRMMIFNHLIRYLDSKLHLSKFFLGLNFFLPLMTAEINFLKSTVKVSTRGHVSICIENACQ